MPLFKRNNQENKNLDNSLTENNRVVQKETIEAEATARSQSQQGDSHLFKAALEDLLSKFKRECAEDEVKQEILKRPIRDKLAELESNKNGIENQIQILKDQELIRLEKDINDCEIAITEVELNPGKYGISENIPSTTRTYFIIGCLLLAAIGIFLAIFYISASYSAFFKDWNISQQDIGIGTKIFDGSAFVNAWQDSIASGLFVTLIFVIFLGLGFLLHVFQRRESKFKWLYILALLVITFIFDFILAYQIESNIYELTRTINTPDFDIPTAFQTVGFWSIIFAGFVTYIIWGLVFDFTMTKWEEFSPVYVFKRKKEKEKGNLKKEKKNLEQEIKEKRLEIDNIISKIEITNNELNEIQIPKNEYIWYHDAYVLGWLTGISNTALPEDRKDNRKAECSRIGDEFKKAFLESKTKIDEN